MSDSNLSVVGSWASILGLLATGILSIFTARLRRIVLRRNRLPQTHADLDELNGKLLSTIPNWPLEMDTALRLAARLSSILRNAEKKLNRDDKSALDELKSRLGAFRTPETRSRAPEESRTLLVALQESLDGYLEALNQSDKDEKQRV